MFQRKPRWLSERKKYVEALASIIEIFPFKPEERYMDSAGDRAKLYDFSTGLIRYFVEALHLTPGMTSLVSIDVDAKREVEVLKQFIWEYIIENPELAVPQKGQRAAIRTVFCELLEASKRKKFHLFPAEAFPNPVDARTGYVSSGGGGGSGVLGARTPGVPRGCDDRSAARMSRVAEGDNG